MEFWDGWFNRWGEPIIKRDSEEMCDAIMTLLKRGSINLYMFHGGSNVGFMNGCSARKDKDLPQVTSYDYDAILDEAGNPTRKWYDLQNRMKKAYPDKDYKEPLIKETMSLTDILLKEKVNLTSTLKNVSDYSESFYPLNMEALGQSTGYILYRTQLANEKREKNTLRLIDTRDRAHIFLDDYLLACQYQEAIGDAVSLPQTLPISQLDILVENMGRVNYGHKLTAPSQKKGIGRGVMVDLHFVSNWKTYCLAMTSSKDIDFSGEWKEGLPSFYHYQFDCQEPKDSYIDMSGFGKGGVFINHHNIGRFWNIGPTLSLYLSKAYLHKGINDIVIFETEGTYQERIQLLNHPVFLDIKGETL